MKKLILLLFVVSMAFAAAAVQAQSQAVQQHGMVGDIAELAKVSNEQGIKNTAFASIIALLFLVETFLLTSFPKQLAAERKNFDEQMDKERAYHREMRIEDRKEDVKDLERMIKSFEAVIRDIKGVKDA